MSRSHAVSCLPRRRHTCPQRLLALALATSAHALAACGSTPAPAIVEMAPPAHSSTASATAKPGGEATVAWRAEEGTISSVLVDAAGTTLAERPEPVVVIDGALHVFRVRTVPKAYCDCNACLGPNGCPDPMPSLPGSIGVPVLTPLGASPDAPEAHSFVEVGSTTTCTTGEAEESFDLFPGTLVGPYFFGTVGAMYMGCLAAHPMWDSQIVALDLRTGQPIETPPPEARLSSLLATADAQLKGQCSMDEEEKPTLWRGIAKLGEDGRIAAEYTFTKSAPYVCGTGPGHYSVATEVVEPGRPSWVPDAVVPKGLEATLFRLHAVGFSSPIRATLVDEARKKFAEPMPPEPAPQ